MFRMFLLGLAIVLLAVGSPLVAQTIQVHYGDDVLRLSMNELDSLSFSEETLVTPVNIDLDINTVAVDAGGAIWSMEVAALLTNADGNPVSNGIPVHFQLTPGIGLVEDVVTGNRPMSGGDPLPGVAYGILRYHSNNTNQTVSLTANCYGPEGAVSDNVELALPVQQPVAVLSISPSNYNYRITQGYAVFAMQIHVFDGHQHPVPNQQIHVSPQFGRVYDSADAVPGGVESPFALTNENGVAERWLIITQTEAFPDPAMPVSTCTIFSEIVGYASEQAEPVTVFLYQ